MAIASSGFRSSSGALPANDRSSRALCNRKERRDESASSFENVLDAVLLQSHFNDSFHGC